ncbi:hypothetical protein PXH59_00235 (plasmid) [Xenorhabdus sp. SF857]|uniref:hypothetical protein n=1 Tax=Xenorhabdus bakwenae TaxID=3026967 RepID=UPI00255839BE|nr:hypothetical protein [Xenorhabdus sp. SF857]WFQ78110.1 hypothetical protein PXH59_00235 [Xenorhabdus sp. SF857]
MNTFPQQPMNDLRIDTAWRENYSGASMNQKLHGLLPKGVYAGFVVKPKNGLNVEITGNGEQSIAVLEVGNYSLTARMPGHIAKQLTLTPGKTQFVVLEAQYAINQASAVGIYVRDIVPANGVMLAKVTLSAESTESTSIPVNSIELALPSKPVTAADFAELAAYTIDNGRRTLNLQEELDQLKKKYIAESNRTLSLQEELTQLRKKFISELATYTINNDRRTLELQEDLNQFKSNIVAELAAYTIDNGRRTLVLQEELHQLNKKISV